MSKVIGIVGSRRRDTIADSGKCFEAFQTIYEEGDSIVSGGCKKGGDKFAEVIAETMGISITIHYPEWKKYGKPAGFIRNTKIAEDCNILIALPHEDRLGGTEDTIKKALALGKKVILV